MKTLKSLLSLTILALFAIFLSQCSKEADIVNPVNKISQQTDGPNQDNVTMNIYEYVLVIPTQGESWYEWRKLATFGCGTGECFNPWQLLYDEFTTPASQRFEGSNTVRSQRFKVVYYCTWGNTPGFQNYAAYWGVQNGIYLNAGHYYEGTGGEWSNTIDPWDVPHSTTLQVIYGSQTYGGDKTNKTKY